MDLSLQSRLMMLVAAALLPLAALSVWSALRETESATGLARSQLRLAASLLASSQERTVESARDLLQAIAAVPGLQAPQRGGCEAFFERLRRLHPVYSNIGLLDPSGNLLCHANGRPGNFNVADREYFRRALATGDFSVGEVVQGRVSGRPTLPFALPLLEDGRVTAVAFASLDLPHAADGLAQVELPPGARVMIADPQGRVLAESADGEQGATGRALADPQLRQLAAAMVAGAGAATDAAGQSRIFAAAPTRKVGGGQFMAFVTVPSANVTAAAAHRLRQELTVVAVTLLLGLAAAWWLGQRMVLKPAKQVLWAVRRLEQGKLDARVPLVGPLSRGEFARIGAAFNMMAESLQLRQADLEAELARGREAYAVLDQVLNSMLEGLVALTADGSLLMHNEAAARVFPMSGAPKLPELWPAHFGMYREDGSALLAADQLPLVRAALGERGQMRVLARNALVPEGRLLQFAWQPMQSGTASGGVAVFADVTELQRLQAEQAAHLEALQVTQRKLVDAQRIGRIGNWELDLPTGRMWWSDEAYELFGVQGPGPLDTLNSFDEMVHPDDRQLLKTARDRALRDGEPVAIQFRVQRPDGRIVWLDAVAQARLGEHGDPVWFGGVVQDVTARKRDEEVLRARENELRELNASLESRIAERTAELERQQQLYRTLAEQAPEVVWNTDTEGNVTYFNRAWYDLVGGSPAQWLAMGWMRAVHPDDRAEVARNWLASRDAIVPYVGTRRILARDGSYHTMSYRAAPVLDDDGKVTSWVGIDTDVTALKSIEQALRSSNQELEAFSYSVSHDLRAPLGAISGFSRALSQKLGPQADPRAAHFMSRIEAGVEKMEQQIEALLSLSRVARAPLEWARVDLGAIARDTLEGLQVQHPERAVQVLVEPDLSAQGDPRLLRIVMENLLGNAWKFTGAETAARIEVGRLPGRPVFFVRDNGVGFEMAYAGKLFTPFHRMHTEAEFPGTGIGLATVRRVLARHEGRVWAESTPGEGTTFFFELPETMPAAWRL